MKSTRLAKVLGRVLSFHEGASFLGERAVVSMDAALSMCVLSHFNVLLDGSSLTGWSQRQAGTEPSGKEFLVQW